MDLFSPTPEAGTPISFVAATYELETDFFMTDLLPSMLSLGTRRDDLLTSPHIIDQALRDCAVHILLDRSQYADARGVSSRVDLMISSTRVQHSKVYLIYWENLIRAIVTSANLTRDGFRKNREVAWYIDYKVSHSSDVSILRNLIEGLENITEVQLNHDAIKSLHLMHQTAKDWQKSQTKKKVSPLILWGGNEKPLISKILDLWPTQTPVKEAHVVSPFWSKNSGPFEALIHGLKSKNVQEDFVLHLYCQGRGDPDVELRPVFPLEVKRHLAKWPLIDVFLHSCTPKVGSDDVSDLFKRIDERTDRFLHAKVILLLSTEITLAAIGSANFTENGLCRNPDSANIELMAVWILNGKALQDSVIANLLPPTLGKIRLVDVDSKNVFEPSPFSEEPKWPDFVELAELDVTVPKFDWKEKDVTSKISTLSIRYRSPKDKNAKFGFHLGDGITDFLLPSTNITRVEKFDLDIPQTSLLLKSREIFIYWVEAPNGIAFPINLTAETKVDLPVQSIGHKPTEDQLIDYFSGWKDRNQLLEVGLRDPEQGQNVTDNSIGIDQRVIQLYTVRSFVECLQGLKKQLEESTSTDKGMRRAFLCEISPVALANSILENYKQSKRTPVAAGFQILELMRTVSSAKITGNTKTKQQIKKRCIDLLNQIYQQLEENANRELSSPIFQAFKNRLLSGEN